MRKNLKNNRGFIKTIILIIVALVILKFVFGITFKDVTENRLVEDFISILKAIFNLFRDLVMVAMEFLKVLFSKIKALIENINI